MPRITYAKNGMTIEVPAGTSFLQACRDHDAPHDFGCTVGSCGTCILTLVSGAGAVDPPSQDELETLEMCTSVQGARLGCQLKVRGDITVQQL
jgi:ferredoxin